MILSGGSAGHRDCEVNTENFSSKNFFIKLMLCSKKGLSFQSNIGRRSLISYFFWAVMVWRRTNRTSWTPVTRRLQLWLPCTHCPSLAAALHKMSWKPWQQTLGLSDTEIRQAGNLGQQVFTSILLSIAGLNMNKWTLTLMSHHVAGVTQRLTVSPPSPPTSWPCPLSLTPWDQRARDHETMGPWDNPTVSLTRFSWTKFKIFFLKY